MTADFVTIAGNLPAETNSFIGRERDLAELIELLSEARMLTLCGPGGIGKTRLAVRLVASLAADYPDGAWLADLADIDDAELLLQLLATALGIRHESGRPLAETLTDALRARSMVLILDTCEHLVEACAMLVQGLLAGCPGLKVIATSREPLRIRGEVVWRVPPLGLPPVSLPPADADGDVAARLDELAGYEAVRLFLDRAAATRPGFSLQPGNAADIARLCRTLDGVPLAIELAAARVRALTAEQIAARLADRFALLASGDRTAPYRQQTMRAAVDWSYDLLTEAEQVLLRRLSVFVGWSLEMAEQVCADSRLPARDVLDLLAALIDKSLVSVDRELNGDVRYKLLDIVRQYAANQAAVAGEVADLRVAHRDLMLRLIEGIAGRAFVRGGPSWPERAAMYDRALAERANVRVALACCADRGDTEEGLRLCCAMGGIWLVAGDSAEGCGWLDRLLAQHRDVSADVRARALAVRAQLAFEQRDHAGAAEHARACLAAGRSGPDGGTAAALRTLALVALRAGRHDEALARAEEAVRAAKAAADEWQLGLAQVVSGVILIRQNRLDEAQAAYEAALESLRDNNSWGVAQTLYGLGHLARIRLDDAAALRYFGEVLAIYRQIDTWPEMARCLADIGSVAISQRNLALARTSLTESLRICLATGRRRSAARGLAALAMVQLASGDPSGALRLAGASLALREAIGEVPSAPAWQRLAKLVEAVTAQLGQAAASASLAQGRAMSPAAAAQFVLAPGPGPAPAHPAAGARQDDPAAGLAPGRPGAPPLTEREREVAALVAAGLSNRAIAGQLAISPSTAARHVANIFAKLGFNSRGQVQAWVAASGSPRGAELDPA
ncbi:MAG TPA: LuxR C-terminal-related transcriptional regulator [Streptosporangiaceae bacterium]|nr:LuxR C-terminal-related transcriptional regulator [Streptosporangiaceae bacterium]